MAKTCDSVGKVTATDRLASLVPQLDNYEIKKGKTLKVNISVPNLRLFVGNIPKSKGKEEIMEEFGKHTGKFSNFLSWFIENFVLLMAKIISLMHKTTNHLSFSLASWPAYALKCIIFIVGR